MTGLPADFDLTVERRSYAEMLPLTDVEAVFKKFCGIAIEKRWLFDARGWESRWKRFCDEEQKYQRKERESGRYARDVDSKPETHNPNPVSARAPVSRAELEEHRRIQAQAALDRDREQSTKARIASTRPPSEPTKLGGTTR